MNRYANAKKALSDEMIKKVKDLRVKIESCVTVLENASPQTIFNRGYSMVCDKNGNIIRDSKQINIGDEIKITPAKGIIEAKVTSNK